MGALTARAAKPKLSGGGAIQQFRRVDAQAADPRCDFGPFLFKELRTGSRTQALGRATIDEHADATTDRDQPIFLKTLIGFCDGQRIGALISRKSPDRGKGVAFLDPAIKDHRDDLVAEAEIDRAIR